MISDSGIHALAGAAGGALSMAVTYPLVNLSTRAQVETKKQGNESTLGAVRRIIQAEGIAGLFDGLESSIVGIAVTNGRGYTGVLLVHAPANPFTGRCLLSLFRRSESSHPAKEGVICYCGTGRANLEHG
jgi:hypothetical protein